jgi:hypothetical protein
MANFPALDRLVTLLERGPSLGPDLHLNHNLRQRGRMWHLSLVAYEGGKRKRIERSLGTTDVAVALDRRDAIINRICDGGGYVVVRESRRG